MAVAAAGCEHTAPFSNTDYQATTPFTPGDPTRLTYSPGLDTRASWLPDGSGFLFTEQQLERRDRDQCLAFMPKSGGTITRLICTDSDVAGDSANVFLAPAVSADLGMAYVRTSTLANVGRPTPDRGALVLATYGSPLPGQQIVPLPFFTPDSQSASFASDLHWTDPAMLFFLADRFQIVCVNPPSCTQLDTNIVGLEIDRVSFGTAAPAITFVPGTVGASALATAGTDTLYYTLSGDGNLHRLILSLSADSVVFTFPGAVTGLSAGGGRIAAAVSGTLHLLTLATATDSVLSTPGPVVVDHPALDPTGRLLVADVTDTSSGLPSDLWLWRLP